jgi:hypothetical protein
VATWLCANLPEPTLTHASKQPFVAAWLTALLEREGFSLGRANQQKFLIRQRLETRIRDLRQQAIAKAYQRQLFGEDEVPGRSGLVAGCLERCLGQGDRRNRPERFPAPLPLARGQYFRAGVETGMS